MTQLSDVQENLRKRVLSILDAGRTNRTELARLCGFQQPHISNFLSRRRGLSLEGLDRLLSVLGLGLEDLMPSVPLAPSALTAVPIVSLELAHYPEPPESRRDEVLYYRSQWLERLAPAPVGPRDAWRRFIVVRAGADASWAMKPLVPPEADLLIDRLSNTLPPARKGSRPMYLVRAESGRNLIRHLQFDKGQLFLRPANNDAPLDYIVIEDGHAPEERILGRVCHVGAAC